MFLELFRDGGAEDDTISRILEMAEQRIRILEMAMQRIMQHPS
jgi:hypothetical protein